MTLDNPFGFTGLWNTEEFGIWHFKYDAKVGIRCQRMVYFLSATMVDTNP